MSEEIVLRQTTSVCPTCLADIPARVVEIEGKVYLRKVCAEHGTSDCLLSEHAWYYGALDRYFFSVMRDAPRQRDYIIRITEKCNLQCPICLASADSASNARPAPVPDMTLHRLCAMMDEHPNGTLKIDLMSSEPTLCPDLPDFLLAIKARGHISSLHSNGIRLLDKEYLRLLKRCGLDEVFLQMDGFDDDAYMRIRGAKLTAQKLQILRNLEEVGVATSLVTVIMPNCNEHEISKVLDYARDHKFIREVMFLGTRPLGFNRGNDAVLMPDQVIDLVERETGGLCPRLECLRFQKLYFALLSILGVRKCLYVQHNLLIRDQGRLRCISEFIDWKRVEPVLDELPHVPNRPWDRFLWLTRLGRAIVGTRALKLLPDFLSLFLRLKFGWRLRQLPFRPLLIGYITACDPENVDRQIGAYCGKGELANDIGFNESGSVANIERERRWAQGPKLTPQAPSPSTAKSSRPAPPPPSTVVDKPTQCPGCPDAVKDAKSTAASHPLGRAPKAGLNSVPASMHSESFDNM